jgi:hypothetical protein
MMTPALTPFQAAVETLRLRGIVLRQLPGEYCVNFRKGAVATEYRTDELADALAHGVAMGEAPAPEPPLGPMGKRITMRGAMCRHNRKLAAKRLRKQSGAAAKA